MYSREKKVYCRERLTNCLRERRCQEKREVRARTETEDREENSELQIVGKLERRFREIREIQRIFIFSFIVNFITMGPFID